MAMKEHVVSLKSNTKGCFHIPQLISLRFRLSYQRLIASPAGPERLCSWSHSGCYNGPGSTSLRGFCGRDSADKDWNHANGILKK